MEMTPRVFKFKKHSEWKPEPEVKAKPASEAKPTYEQEFVTTSELEQYRKALRDLWEQYRTSKAREQQQPRQWSYPYYYEPVYGISSTINTQDSNTVNSPQWSWGGNLPNITK